MSSITVLYKSDKKKKKSNPKAQNGHKHLCGWLMRDEENKSHLEDYTTHGTITQTAWSECTMICVAAYSGSLSLLFETWQVPL